MYAEFNKEIPLRGSSKAIRTWGSWRISSTGGNAAPNDVLFSIEKVLIQLRKDMGLKRGIERAIFPSLA